MHLFRFLDDTLREVVKKSVLFSVSLTEWVDPPRPPLIQSAKFKKKVKTSYYECIWPETDFGNFFLPFLTILGWA